MVLGRLEVSIDYKFETGLLRVLAGFLVTGLLKVFSRFVGNRPQGLLCLRLVFVVWRFSAGYRFEFACFLGQAGLCFWF